jgi:uroporphyrinogen-III synthase
MLRDRDGPLAGLAIMVTRAAHQARPLCRLIEDAGGRAVRLPVLEIQEPQDGSRLDGLIDRLGDFDIAVFVSANAVERAIARIRARGASLAQLKLAAIGRKTADTLEALGYAVDLYPRQGFTSEDLLALGELHAVRGRRVVIFRGEGGREFLAEALQTRGAAVEYAEVYRRAAPSVDRQAMARYFDDEAVDLVAVSSAEGLRNLDGLCGARLRRHLRRIPLLVGSERMLETARGMNFATAMAARDPSDEAMFDAMLQWAKDRQERSK